MPKSKSKVTTGEVIKLMRVACKMTQHQVAEKSGCSRTYLIHVETGVKKPGVEFILRMIDVLNIPPHLLLEVRTKIGISKIRTLGKVLSQRLLKG